MVHSRNSNRRHTSVFFLLLAGWATKDYYSPCFSAPSPQALQVAARLHEKHALVAGPKSWTSQPLHLQGLSAEKTPVKIGGAQTETWFTAVVAAASILTLSWLDIVLGRSFGPMYRIWAPPLGAVALIFATDAAAAAQRSDILSPSAMFKRGMQTVTGVVGTCFVTVLLIKLFGPTILGRAAAVGVASLFMTWFPACGYFPPAGAFCALYIDKGAPGFGFPLFPSGVGTLVLFVASRVIAAALAGPLRKLRGGAEPSVEAAPA